MTLKCSSSGCEEQARFFDDGSVLRNLEGRPSCQLHRTCDRHCCSEPIGEVDWRDMFIRYVEIVGLQERVDFLHKSQWTATEWAALDATGQLDYLYKEGSDD